MFLPSGITHPEEIRQSVAALEGSLPGAVNLRYTVDNDWSGDPAIFFRITLSDEAARREVLGRTSRTIRDLIEQRLDPMRQWGLIPYFNFRSQSEQAELKEEVFG
jgi:hypothetical protein